MSIRIHPVAVLISIAMWLVIIAAIIFGVKVAANADTTPGVVTHHEFQRVHKTMTRHEVTHIFGVKGHVVNGAWDRGKFYIAVVYPYRPGGTVAVVFVDPDTSGGPWSLVKKYRAS